METAFHANDSFNSTLELYTARLSSMDAWYAAMDRPVLSAFNGTC